MVLALFINVLLSIRLAILYCCPPVIRLLRRISAMVCPFGTFPDLNSDYGPPAPTPNKNYADKGGHNKNTEPGGRQKHDDAEETVNQLFTKIEELETQLKEKESVIKLYRDENNSLKLEHRQLKHRSDTITSKMADLMDCRSDFENTGDEDRNSKLAERLQSIQRSQWATLLENLMLCGEHEEDELLHIQRLTSLMETCYKEVVQIAKEQIKHFLWLNDDEEDIPGPFKEPALYQIRRECGRKPHVLEKVKENVLMSVEIKEEEEKEEGLFKFLNDFIECCWLMTISQHPLVLKFDVVDEPFIDQLKTRFTKYSTQVHVVSPKEKGTVTQVAWPSVETADESSVVSKGEVITVDKRESDL